MMERIRVSKQKQVGVFDDIPLDESCFGKMFDLTYPECQYCADQSFCAATKWKNLPLVEVETPFLDESKLSTLDRKGLVAKFIDKPYILMEIEVKTQGKVGEILAKPYCKILLDEFSLTVKNGIIKNE